MPRTVSCSTAVLVTGLLAAGCNAPAASDPAAAGQVRAAMSAYTASLPVGADSTASFFADSGTMLAPGMPPIRGRKAMGEWLVPLFKQYEVKDAGNVAQAVDVASDVATLWGTYNQTVGLRSGGDAQAYTGRFVTSWKKGGDGRWRIALMMTQPDPAPQMTPPVATRAPK